MRFLVLVSTLLAAVAPISARSGQQGTDAGPDTAIAASYFAEARALADRDGGRLWGVRLDGPMLFVDPATRRVVANQADAEGRLVGRDGVFAGQIDDDVAVANTAVTWSGVHWTMIVWPLPSDPGRRAELMAHEMFHRVQASLRLPMSNPANAHLDTLDGRYWLQLEWRALRAALESPGPGRAAAVADALAFRAQVPHQYRLPLGCSPQRTSRTEGLLVPGVDAVPSQHLVQVLGERRLYQPVLAVDVGNCHSSIGSVLAQYWLIRRRRLGHNLRPASGLRASWPWHRPFPHRFRPDFGPSPIQCPPSGLLPQPVACAAPLPF